MTGTRRVDAVVVGAGPTGAHVAGRLAAQGRAVVLVDRRPMDRAGAQWHNGVLAWQFAQAGVAAPIPDEISPAEGRTHMFGPDGTHACTYSGGPTVRADMGALGEALRGVAAQAGVTLVDRVAVVDVDVDDTGRIRAVTLDPVDDRASSTGRMRLDADLFVDASGRTGVLRRHAPALTPWCPTVRGPELCSATDAVLTVRDPDGARRFLDAHGAEPGDTVMVLGNAGGWSTCSVRVADDLTRVAALVGCVADGRHGTGPNLLARLRADHDWLGEPEEVGTGVIPLRRPYARFTAPGLALVGDAACQVFPVHASGIGSGLMAARMLTDAVDGADDPGDEAVLWRYQHRFQRELGGMFAALDGFRRMSTELGSDGVRRMVHGGMFDPDTVVAALDQTWTQPAPSTLPRNAWAMVRAPRLARIMVPRLARGAVLRTMGNSYPERVDVDALTRWDAKVERLLGALPA